jgi:hypothetical protein
MSTSKPSLNFVDPNLNVKDNKNIININTQGIVQQKGGKIYMTADVKEDIFLPIMYTDSSNNLQEVIRSVTQEDNNRPAQFRNPMIDEEIMY